MAQPTPFEVQHEYVSDEGVNPNFPGTELDIDFGRLTTTLDEILANLALIQRDDGELANNSVGLDQLTSAVEDLIEIGSAENVDAAIELLEGAVRVDEEQTFTSGEQLQARTNIGAYASADLDGDLSDIAVRFDEVQTLSDSEQEQARDNIGALSASGMALTPQMFGAAGDGVTDDTDALQDWLDQGGALTCTGHFLHDATLVVDIAGTHITGRDAKFEFVATSKTRAWRIRGNGSDGNPDVPVDDVTIEGIEIDYRRDLKDTVENPIENDSYIQAHGILAVGNRIVIKDCVIRDVIEHGVVTQFNPPNDGDVVDGITVTGCHFFDIGNSESGRGLPIWLFGNVRNVVITGNFIDESCQGGIGVDEASGDETVYDRYFYNAIISNNIIHSAQMGIRYEGTMGAAITGNKVLNYYNDDRSFTTHSAIAARAIDQNDHFPPAGEVVIADNVVESSVIGIEMQNLRDAVVTGNKVRYTGHAGIGDGLAALEKGAITYFANSGNIISYTATNETATTLDPSALTGAITITASSTTGINNDTGFTDKDVGRSIDLYYTDTWYRAEITAVNSTTNVDATVGAVDFPVHTAVATWRLVTPALGANILVADNIIDTTERGIHFGDLTETYGAASVPTPGVAVRGNTITYRGLAEAVSGFDAIHMNRVTGAVVADNLIRDFYDGITNGTDDVDGLIIRDNDIIGSVNFGIQLSGTDEKVVMGNTSIDAGVADLRVEAAADIAGTITGGNVFTEIGGTYANITQISRSAGMRRTDPWVLYQSAVAVTHTGDTNETALRTITLPGYAMGTNGSVRITHIWSLTSDASDKTVRVRFGGPAGTDYYGLSVAAMSAYTMQTTIANRNATNSQMGRPAPLTTGITGTGWGGTSAAAIVTSAVDTTAAVDIVISIQLADAADTVTLQYVLVEVIP
jgi:hypothetical protein